jgi:hypothetical protein
MERENTRERSMAGQRKRVARGEYFASVHPPYG